jgi:hypothetical protein
MDRHLRRCFELLNSLPEEFSPDAADMMIEALQEMALASVAMHRGTAKQQRLEQAEREFEASIPRIRAALYAGGVYQKNWRGFITNLRNIRNQKECH